MALLNKFEGFKLDWIFGTLRLAVFDVYLAYLLPYSGHELAVFTTLVNASTFLSYNKKHTLAKPEESTALGDLLRWQVEEADIIAINKVDLVPRGDLLKSRIF